MLQPTAQPKTKNAGLVRHQVAILILGFPSIILGTLAVYYNKWLRSKKHFSTWHGVCLSHPSYHEEIKPVKFFFRQLEFYVWHGFYYKSP